MKKGDKVLIDIDGFMDDDEYINTDLNPHLTGFEEFKKIGNFKEIINRKNKIATITSMDHKRQYVNLEFEDGFKCGIKKKYLRNI